MWTNSQIIILDVEIDTISQTNKQAMEGLSSKGLITCQISAISAVGFLFRYCPGKQALFQWLKTLKFIITFVSFDRLYFKRNSLLLFCFFQSYQDLVARLEPVIMVRFVCFLELLLS